MTSNRVQWVDFAKGITIILVVLMHSLYRELYSEPIFYVSGLLESFRMPLFFFLSGLFIHKTINSSFSHFFKTKVVYLLYLYVLWSIIRYFTNTVPRNLLLNDSEENLNSIFYIFVDPPGTVWFIYALLIFLIITWVTRSVPIITLCVAMLIFIFSMQYNEYNFAIKIAKFYPLFLLGYLMSNFVINIANRVRIYHIIFPILFLVVAAITKDFQFSNTAHGFFILSCGGILTGIIIASIISKINVFSWLGYIGKNTLPIYLMHFLPLGVLKIVLPKFIPNLPSLAILIMVVSGVALPLIAASLAKKYQINWLLAVPFINFKVTKQFSNKAS